MDPIGRAQEMAVVGAALADVIAGRPRIVAVRGGAGIGKTTVWAAAVDQGRRLGFEALACRPVAAEAELAFAGLMDLLAPVDDGALDELPGPQRNALRAALLRAGDGSSVNASLPGTAAGVCQLLGALARRTPVLVAVDDVHWLDSPTAQVLRFALRRLAGRRVGFVLAARDGDPSLLDGLSDDIGDRLLDVAVGPLSVGALHHVLVEREGRVLRRPDLVHLHAVCAGNPLFALEIVRALPPGARIDLEELPGSLPPLLTARLARLSAEGLQAVRISALLARPTPEVVSRVLGDPVAAARALVEVERAEVLVEREGMLRFDHPLLAAAALAPLGPGERRLLHADLAVGVDDPDEVARHRARAAIGPDSATAAALESAADRAADRGATAMAADLAERAAALTPVGEPEARLRRLSRAGWRHFIAGDQTRAAMPLEEVAARATGVTRAVAEAALGGVYAMRGDVEKGEMCFARADALLADQPDLRALVLVAAARVTQFRDVAAAEPLAARARETAGTAADQGLVPAAEQMVAWLDLLLGRGVDLGAARIRAAAPESPVVPVTLGATWFLTTMLVAVDALDEAAVALAGLADRASASGDIPALRDIHRALADVRLRQGRLDDATEAAVGADELVWLPAEDHTTATEVEVTRARIAGTRGDVVAARAHAATALDLASAGAGDHRLERLAAEAAAGFVALAAGDPEAARDHLLVAEQVTFDLHLGEPGLVPFHGDLIEALVQTGAFDEAKRVAMALEADGSRLHRIRALAVAARGRGLVAAGRGDLDGAVSALGQAVEYHADLPAPFELGRTLLALGGVLRRAKRKRAARQALQDAREFFAEIGAGPWVARCDDELSRISGATPGRTLELSPTERQVAELVAAGLTNREVAARLFISVRTVEANLTRAYRKLAVRSRTELAARLSP